VTSIQDERDKLSIQVSERTSELEQQAELALKRTVEFEYLQHENREVSTKLVSLESLQTQHISELEVLRRDLDSAEFSYKEAEARTETVLSNMSDLEARLEEQSHVNKEKLAQLSSDLESERASGLQAASALESELLAAQQQIGQLDSANTEAVMEIAKLRSRQPNTPQVVRPPSLRGGAVVPSGIGSVDDVDVGHDAITDSRAKRLEGELAEANSRLRATASGVVWSARREPDEKEGILGRLKGTIRRNGDS
jgi:DNA repair exonuclease SbcCD ATPase subunit